MTRGALEARLQVLNSDMEKLGADLRANMNNPTVAKVLFEHMVTLAGYMIRIEKDLEKLSAKA